MEYNELIDEDKELDKDKDKKELRVGDYAVFQNDCTEQITIGRICDDIPM